MKIFCQERYDEAMKHAKETNDPTLQKCLDKLKSWETNLSLIHISRNPEAETMPVL